MRGYEESDEDMIYRFDYFLKENKKPPLTNAEVTRILKAPSREAAFIKLYKELYKSGGGKSQYKSHVTQHMERMFPSLVGKYDILGKYAPTYTVPRVMENREKPVSPPSNSKEYIIHIYNRLLWADNLPKLTKADEELILRQLNDKTRDDVFEEIKNRLLSEQRKKRTKLSKKHKSRRKSALTSRRKTKSRSS